MNVQKPSIDGLEEYVPHSVPSAGAEKTHARLAAYPQRPICGRVGADLLYALIISINSFHGRGFFPAGFLPTLPMEVCAACEAIIGLTIEMSCIATFMQPYFGK
jgi:hypothetical protein